MNAQNRKLLLTADGSHTLSLENSDITYHSRHGAITESRHVFIEAGLHYCIAQTAERPLHILEMGFGTGLNALLTVIEAGKTDTQLIYTSIEAFPLSEAEYELLNYGEVLQQQALFQQLHAAPWNQTTETGQGFQLRKIQSKLEHWENDQLFHCIYYDAFAPGEQPELWTAALFERLYQQLQPGGILVTYCSKSDVRRAMQAAGFTVTKLPGPPGKREMVRAGKH
jgi:tRNA U34 5-methylaminomethyl-2-thiouridine-forming methyltransferase MnmC